MTAPVKERGTRRSFPKIPRGEKISHEGGPAVSKGSAQTFCPRGGVCKEAPRDALATRPSAQAYRLDAAPRRFDLLRFSCISRAVLRLWQLWQRLSRLLRSQNFDQSPLWSTMWSTSVARTRRPCRAHSRQNGSRRSCAGRRSSFHSSVWYIQRQDCASSLRRSPRGRWASQYPSLTSTQQPGCRQGRSGFKAIGLSPPGKTKSHRQRLRDRSCQQWLLSEHAPCSIFTRFDALHRRHQRIRLRASVSGRTACDVVRPQLGQTISPSFVTSLPSFRFDCNTFCLLFDSCLQIKHSVQVETFYRSIILDS